MKIAILGAGNLGGAVARGLVRGGIDASCVTLTAAHAASLEKFAAEGFATATDNAAAVRGADFVCIAVKPWIFEQVAREIAPVLDADTQMLVCMAPGIPAAKLEALFPGSLPIAYVIPNTAAEVAASATILSPVRASGEQMKALEALTDRFGKTFRLDAAHMMAGTATTSCGIAYALRYIRAAVEGAVELGIPAATALQAVSATVTGAAALLDAHGSHPEAEIDKVTTPGGLTIKGLNAMEEGGFTAAVVSGLKAGTK
ncbi:MAG: NAD(P)-binding domain-containing protein [Bacteroidales bacterium]|nr:NAD(P)-binding domain-containing protein [Bacteroidales bacterium]